MFWLSVILAKNNDGSKKEMLNNWPLVLCVVVAQTKWLGMEGGHLMNLVKHALVAVLLNRLMIFQKITANGLEFVLIAKNASLNLQRSDANQIQKNRKSKKEWLKEKGEPQSKGVAIISRLANGKR